MDVGGNSIWKNLLALDASWSERLRLNPRQSVRWGEAVILAHSGDSWLWAAGLGLLWLLDDGPWHERAALMALAVVVQALLIFTIKQTIRRERPQGEWGEIYRNFDPHSFPSGHATRASLLAVMALGLGPEWFGVLLTLWAPLVSLARVATGVHYLSDVLAGTAIGLLMGLGMLALRGSLMTWLPFLF